MQNETGNEKRPSTVLDKWLDKFEEKRVQDLPAVEHEKVVKTICTLMTAFKKPAHVDTLITLVVALGGVARERGRPGVHLQEVAGVTVWHSQRYCQEGGDTEFLREVVPARVTTVLHILWDMSLIKEADVETGMIGFAALEVLTAEYGVRELSAALREEPKFLERFLPETPDRTSPTRNFATTHIMREIFTHRV